MSDWYYDSDSDVVDFKTDPISDPRDITECPDCQSHIVWDGLPLSSKMGHCSNDDCDMMFEVRIKDVVVEAFEQ